MTRDLRSRIRGCLVGQALGDAFGFPVEGYGPDVCRPYADAHLGPDATLPRGRSPFPFGQITDDTQLARELVLSYVQQHTFDPADYARRIAVLFEQERVVGRGLATEEAAQRLQCGVPWNEAGTPAPSAGNGSAMRAAPIGIFFHADGAQRARTACEQSQITHRDPRCLAGSVAIAEATALALRGDVPLEAWPSVIAGAMIPIDPGFAACVADLARWVQLEPDEAAARIARAGLPNDHEDDWRGISPFVVGSVTWSLYAFLKSPEDPLRALHVAIAVGGDVDTTAAMTGAIAGAHLGLAAWPSELTRHIQDQGAWRETEWLELADRLCASVDVSRS
ncbi:MAG: ADP-ribosylglycohydrolase family protein [Planctomycetes bacterium]|nr:ADP-ribosylglycohydrolase family protein [Planctomycetota bacterium]